MATTGLTHEDIFTGKVPGSSRWWPQAPADDVIAYRRKQVERLLIEEEIAKRGHPRHWAYDVLRHEFLISHVDRCDARLAELGVPLPAGETPTPKPIRASIRWFKTAPLCELFAYVEERRKAFADAPTGKSLGELGAYTALKTLLHTAERRLAERLGAGEAQFREAAE